MPSAEKTNWRGTRVIEANCIGLSPGDQKNPWVCGAAPQGGAFAFSFPARAIDFVLMKLPFPSRITGFAILLTLVSHASAIVFRWDNPGSGLWNDAVNWENDTLLFNDDAQINNGGTALIDSTQTVITGFATMGGGLGNGTILMSGGSLSTNFDIRVGGNVVAGGGTGLFEQSGGDIFMNGGNFNVGFGLTAIGTYIMTGGTLIENSGAIFAVGNRGIGTVIQSGGSIYVRGASAVGTSVVQLGRNSNAAGNGNGIGSGRYDLSGGILATAFIRYGQVVSGAGVIDTNTFTLRGAGRLITGTIEIFNTAATNSFNFTGGVLTANTIGIPITNNGGILSPATANFAANAVDISSIPLDPIGTTTFNGSNAYNQGSTGSLAIDIDFGANDLVDIGAGAPVVASSIAGKIYVNVLNGFDPPIGSTFDILTADSITYTASVIGHTPSCNVFKGVIVIGLDGRQVLRLVVVSPPALYSEYQGLFSAGPFDRDDDSDGLFNGVEYLLGLVPNDPNGVDGAAGAPVVSFTGSGANKRLRIEFSVPEPGPTDATLLVEASDDLGVTDPGRRSRGKSARAPGLAQRRSPSTRQRTAKSTSQSMIQNWLLRFPHDLCASAARCLKRKALSLCDQASFA